MPHNYRSPRQSTRSVQVAVLSLGVVAAGLAQAQMLEEVVVTAQKRSESLQDVPIAMSAFTDDQLDRLGVQSAEQVLALVPNAGTVPQGGAKQNLFIRGVGTADFHLNVVGAVGAFLDDVSLNSPFAISFATYDMERVEVLRGPQNTLFGRNTTGGAVNYISRKPSVDDGLNGYIQGGVGRYSQLDIEGAVGFPLSDTVAVRIAGVSNTRDGAFNNVTLGEDVGERDRQGLRAQLSWIPGRQRRCAREASRVAVSRRSGSVQERRAAGSKQPHSTLPGTLGSDHSAEQSQLR